MKDLAQKWEELIEELLVLAAASRPSKLEIANFHPKLGAVNLAQPFDWKAWGEPFPEPEQAQLLDLKLGRARGTNETALKILAAESTTAGFKVNRNSQAVH